MFRRKKEDTHPGNDYFPRRRPRHIIGLIFMMIGIVTVVYLLITQVLMRVLALMTV